MQKIIRFINEVRQEISKVIWPSREELYGSVVVVIILCVLLSLFLFVADYILNRLFEVVF
jgi:preprotein translocase subunit SecE